jgi:hypothetical protein
MKDPLETIPKTDFFGEGPNLWKSTRIWFCQTGGMPLWLGLQLASCLDCVNGYCENKREEYKKAVLSFPYEVGSCRCKDCRYFRMAKK